MAAEGVAAAFADSGRHGLIYLMTMAFPINDPPQTTGTPPEDHGRAARSHEWLGRLGDAEPAAYAALTVAERIQLVWPITLAAWAFSGKPYDESRLRRDIEHVGRRGR